LRLERSEDKGNSFIAYHAPMIPQPGVVIAIQTFGDFLGFNPHGHILVTDGCFYGKKGMFRLAPVAVGGAVWGRATKTC
jgi:Putative transposase.